MKIDLSPEEVEVLRSLTREKLKKLLKYHSQREFARVQVLFSILKKVTEKENRK